MIGLTRRIGSKGKGILVRVGKNAAALLASQVGARALNLFLTIVLTRSLGPAALGQYLVAITAQSLVLAIADLGLNTFTTREFAKTEGGEARDLWGVILSLKLAAAMVGGVLLVVLVAPLFGGERQILLSIAAVALLPDAFNAAATAHIKARQRMEVCGAINLGIRASHVLAGGLLLLSGFGIRSLVAAYGLVSTVGSLAFWVILRRWQIQPAWRSSVRRWPSVLGASLPFALTGMLTMLYSRMDLLMLSWWRGDAAAGRYGLVYRLWEVMVLLPASLLDALFPELARTAGRADVGERFWSLYRRGRRALWVIAPVMVLSGEAAAPLLLSLFSGRTHDASMAVPLLRWLLLALPFTYLYLLNGHALYAIGQQRRVTIAVSVVALVNLVCNAALVWRWGDSAVVGAKLFSEGLLAVLLQAVLSYAYRKGVSDR